MRNLTLLDHRILLAMIQGHDNAGLVLIAGITEHAVRARLKRMRQILECNATYQLVALEVVNLMGSDAACRSCGGRKRGEEKVMPSEINWPKTRLKDQHQRDMLWKIKVCTLVRIATEKSAASPALPKSFEIVARVMKNSGMTTEESKRILREIIDYGRLEERSVAYGIVKDMLSEAAEDWAAI